MGCHPHHHSPTNNHMYFSIFSTHLSEPLPSLGYHFMHHIMEKGVDFLLGNYRPFPNRATPIENENILTTP